MTSPSRLLCRRLWRFALLLLAVACGLGAIAPFISAAAFSGRIERALQASLGRKVSFSKAHFSLFTGPGFSLDDVVIQEDPRYGIEPFAHVPTLEARLRIDRLLVGHIAFSSLRLVEPSLNLVKRDDGSWNVADLVDRLSAPSNLPVNLFPAVQVSDGRIDFKFGMRKTLLYITNAGLSIYPESSGKLYVRFSGSPARTDRAGSNGFGYLHGTANWYLRPASAKGAVARRETGKQALGPWRGAPDPAPVLRSFPSRADANQLEADVMLDPSNLSDLTTLIEGEDAGVHGTVSSHLKLEGPATALRLAGDVHLADVHRWDLLPASGEDWRIPYKGNVDLVAHRFEIATLPARSGESSPVVLRLAVNDFLRRPAWSVLANFINAPAEQLLPFSRRMGFGLPDGLHLAGTLNGAVGYSNKHDLTGGVSITNVVATLANDRSLRAAVLRAHISPDRVRFDPAVIETQTRGALRIGGDYNLATHQSDLSLSMVDLPVVELTKTYQAWFGVPPGLAEFREGDVTGQIAWSQDSSDISSWSGQFRFANATLSLPGFAIPLTDSEGRVELDEKHFNLDRFRGHLGKELVSARYRFNGQPDRPQRLHIEVSAADLSELEAALEPTLQAQSFFARLGVTRRSVPAWLKHRNVEGDLSIAQFSIDGAPLGAVQTHFVWQGTDIRFPSFHLNLPQGSLEANGGVNLTASSPRYQFEATVADFPWRGGMLSAAGRFQTYGLGSGALEHLHADGTFTGQDISVSPDDQFQAVSGTFRFSFLQGWPDIQLAGIQASQGEEAWTGAASSQSDGTLVVDLENAGRQRRIISNLEPQLPSAASADGRLPE